MRSSSWSTRNRRHADRVFSRPDAPVYRSASVDSGERHEQTRACLDPLASVEANRSKPPAHTRWVWIEGGNHSHFGWYGFQPGGRRATIAATTQRDLMTQAVLDALRRGVTDAPPS
jgi:hypothetical protein